MKDLCRTTLLGLLVLVLLITFLLALYVLGTYRVMAEDDKALKQSAPVRTARATPGLQVPGPYVASPTTPLPGAADSPEPTRRDRVSDAVAPDEAILDPFVAWPREVPVVATVRPAEVAPMSPLLARHVEGFLARPPAGANIQRVQVTPEFASRRWEGGHVMSPAAVRRVDTADVIRSLPAPLQEEKSRAALRRPAPTTLPSTH